ncbi:MAG: RDD family protein [Patescibacteria group bacterium]
MALTYASFWRRLGAILLDGLIISIINGLFGAIVGVIFGQTDTASWINQLLSMIVGISYYVYFIGNRGQTPGKMVLKIKVVKIGTEETVGYGGAFMREVVGKFLSGISLGLGYLWSIWDHDKQTWHDKIAKTVVVKV